MTETGAETREEIGRVMRDRLAKLEALRERGVEPFAYAYERTHEAQQALDLFRDEDDAELRVSVAGRLVSRRDMGKSTFAHLADRLCNRRLDRIGFARFRIGREARRGRGEGGKGEGGRGERAGGLESHELLLEKDGRSVRTRRGRICGLSSVPP